MIEIVTSFTCEAKPQKGVIQMKSKFLFFELRVLSCPADKRSSSSTWALPSRPLLYITYLR